MTQIALLAGLVIVLLIIFRIMTRIASFVFRIGILLALVIAGYVWWQYGRH
jgi:hypothetical protein